MKHPRYIVSECSGYPISGSGQTAGDAKLCTEVLVLDRCYCHRVVWSSLTAWYEHVYRYTKVDRRYDPPRLRPNQAGKKIRPWRTATLEDTRAFARELCERLNREDAEASA